MTDRSGVEATVRGKSRDGLPVPSQVERILLAQIDEACEIARAAFAAGDLVTGIAALTVVAQLVQLARIFERGKP